MIIQDPERLDLLYKRLSSEISYIFPIFISFDRHVLNNKLSSVHIMFESGEYYCIPIDHIDVMPMKFDLKSVSYAVTPDKKIFLHCFDNVDERNVYDFKAYQYLNNKKLIEISDYYTRYMRTHLSYSKFDMIANVFPISALVDFGRGVLLEMRSQFSQNLPPGYDFFNRISIQSLKTVESSGIYVDKSKFIHNFGTNQEIHIHNSTVYTEYNLYTATGRPSNKFGGVNYAALEKTEAIRSTFISRYANEGTLFQFDYEAFHPRLIANKVNYQLPNTSFHEHMAKFYYNSEAITEEQYEDSKKKTFHFLYGVGGGPSESEFFSLINSYTSHHFNEYMKNGYYISNSGKRLRVENVSQNRLFNYIIQLLETEVFLSRLYKVNEILKGSLTKPVLYTYDALLLDVHKSDINILRDVRSALEGENKKYPVRAYAGSNYGDLRFLK